VRLALFDVDGTLVSQGTERAFWRELRAAGMQPPRQWLEFALFALRYWPTGGIHTFKKNKAYLAGLEVEAVAALGAGWVRERIDDMLIREVCTCLERHRTAGDHVVLLSGTLDFIARPLAARLGANEAVGTICAERNGRFLPEPPELHPFGAAKLTLARRIAERTGLPLDQAAAYGDSKHDLPLLEAVMEPVVCAPGRTLSQVALARGWRVIEGRGQRRPALPG
jgi:HAD superfamily hydrolase (TIGR01490 family)